MGIRGFDEVRGVSFDVLLPEREQEVRSGKRNRRERSVVNFGIHVGYFLVN